MPIFQPREKRAKPEPVQAPPKPKAPRKPKIVHIEAVQTTTSTPAPSTFHTNTTEERIRGCWNTGYGFLLRSTQTIKEGRIAELIEVEENIWIECFTPPIPTDLTKVYGYGKTREEQVWNREEMMKDDKQNPAYMDLRYIQKDIDKKSGKIKWYNLNRTQEAWVQKEEDTIWIYGFWLFIDGCLTWLHGCHYLELKYWNINAETDDGFKEYRDADRRWYMNWDDVEKTPLEIGVTQPKFRRMGGTERGLAQKFWYARSKNGLKSAFIMDDGTKTKGKFSSSFIGPYNKLPLWLRGTDVVDVSSTQVNMSWRNPLTGNIDGTGSMIFYKNTTVQALNGEKLGYGLFDETGKYDIDLKAFWGVHRLCFTLGADSRKVGMCYLPTTVEEMKSGTQYLQLVEDSKRSAYNPVLKRTNSGLRLYFQSAEDGLENFTDPWGNSQIEDPTDPYVIEWRRKKGHIFYDIGSRRYIQENLDNLSKQGKWEDYTAFLRAHPRKLEDIFVNKAGENGFNGQKLQRLITNLQSNAKASPVRTGRLTWVNKNDWSKGVLWEDDANGNFETIHTWSDWSKEANNCEWIGKDGRPLNTNLGCITVDPYQLGIVIDTENGSKGAAHGLWYFNKREWKTRWRTDQPGTQRSNFRPTPQLYFSYSDRPLDIDDFYEDMAKACVYWGVKMAHENNHDGISTYFIRKGMEQFLVPSNDFLPLDQRTKSLEGKYGFHMDVNAATHLQAVGRFISGTDAYLEGYNYDIGSYPARWDHIPFLATAKDLHAFNLAKRKKHDKTMSLVPGLILMETILYELLYSEPTMTKSDQEWATSFSYG